MLVLGNQDDHPGYPALRALTAVSLAAAILTGTVCAQDSTYNGNAAQSVADIDEAYARGDYATALQLILPLANGGNAVAQFNLGQMYDNGNGIPQDHAEAARWFRKAADQGLAAGQFNVGVSYEKGRGLPQNYAEAAKWYRKAADQDFAMAEYNLGVLYARGRGVAQNDIEAHKWFSLAASPYLAADKATRAIAAKSRDLLAARMTPAQIVEAQRLARDWKPTQ